MRVLRERAIYATDSAAVGCAHGTAQRVAYINSNGRTFVAAIVNAHVHPIRLADGAADAESNGPTDSDANQRSDACAEPSTEFTGMRIFTNSSHRCRVRECVSRRNVCLAPGSL